MQCDIYSNTLVYVAGFTIYLVIDADLVAGISLRLSASFSFTRRCARLKVTEARCTRATSIGQRPPDANSCKPTLLAYLVWPCELLKLKTVGRLIIIIIIILVTTEGCLK